LKNLGAENLVAAAKDDCLENSVMSISPSPASIVCQVQKQATKRMLAGFIARAAVYLGFQVTLSGYRNVLHSGYTSSYLSFVALMLGQLLIA
jgi:phosphopantothenoylcysteine synthetase/decarboxylase